MLLGHIVVIACSSPQSGTQESYVMALFYLQDECIARFKHLAELIKRKKDAVAKGDKQ